MIEAIEVRRDLAADGLGHEFRLVGNWPAETAFATSLLGAGLSTLRTTIKVALDDGTWALYRVVGITSDGNLTARRIRRGRTR